MPATSRFTVICSASARTLHTCASPILPHACAHTHPPTCLSICPTCLLMRPTLVHDAATSLINDAATSLIHDAATSLIHDAATSLIHDAATSLIHDAATSLIHDAATSLIHDAATSLIHDAATSLIHDAATSLIHDAATSLIHDAATSLIHEAATSFIHDAATSLTQGKNCTFISSKIKTGDISFAGQNVGKLFVDFGGDDANISLADFQTNWKIVAQAANSRADKQSIWDVIPALEYP